MIFDKRIGLWKKSQMEDVTSTPFNDEEEDEIIGDNIVDPESVSNEPQIKGHCILTIRFETEEDFKKYKKYNHRNEWEFLVNYPALFRARYEFKSSLDVDVITKKIVQLLQMGFDVYSAQWILDQS